MQKEYKSETRMDPCGMPQFREAESNDNRSILMNKISDK